jgi:hypothetical protein
MGDDYGRGNSLAGNTLNRAQIGLHGLTDHETLSGGSHKGIGLALPLQVSDIFTTDLGGLRPYHLTRSCSSL